MRKIRDVYIITDEFATVINFEKHEVEYDSNNIAAFSSYNNALKAVKHITNESLKSWEDEYPNKGFHTEEHRKTNALSHFIEIHIQGLGKDNTLANKYIVETIAIEHFKL